MLCAGISDIVLVIVLGRLIRIRAGEYRRGIGVVRDENGVLVVLGSIANERGFQI